MLLKIWLLSCFGALLVMTDNRLNAADDVAVVPAETRVQQSVSFESAHKRLPPVTVAAVYQTAHKINLLSAMRDNEAEFGDLTKLQESMNLLPTKERPELNPILSALINEDVMKSIEAKRAIEQEELDIIRAETLAAVQQEERKLLAADDEAAASVTEAPAILLTTVIPLAQKKAQWEGQNEANDAFVDQTITLDAAGSENNKKSRIEIKKGPNGQDYEYEYVYYYDDDEDEAKPKTPAAVGGTGTAAADVEKETRGKSRYMNIERQNAVSPLDNTLISGKAKGRSTNVGGSDDIDVDRLPLVTRFPSRVKGTDVASTPPNDSLETGAEKKRISVKRPSLELVDSETFNTDEKQVKGTRNGDTEVAKQAALLEHEQALVNALARGNEAAAVEASEASARLTDGGTTDSAADETVDVTTKPMEKAALDLYAILANENLNGDMTTDPELGGTTLAIDTTDADALTTLLPEQTISLSTITTTTTTPSTTTTTTETPVTTTTAKTTTAVTSLFAGKRAGVAVPGRNRYKLKSGGGTTTTTTDAPAPAESAVKASRNRFARPPIGGRQRPSTRTTAAPQPSSEPEEASEKKEMKSVGAGIGVGVGFVRGRQRNRFNIRLSTTTEKVNGDDSAEEAASDTDVSSTTARPLRNRPTLNLRGRSRTTTTMTTTSKAPITSNDGQVVDVAAETTVDEKTSAKPSRFNLSRPSSGRLLPRGKFGRTTETPARELSADDDSAVDSSHHNDVKEEGGSEGGAPKADGETVTGPHAAIGGSGIHRLKGRPLLNNIQKTESSKPKVTTHATVMPRKANPLLAKRRLQLGSSTTEAVSAKEESSGSADVDSKEEPSATATTGNYADSAKEDTTEEAETTTKQQARGLGLLGQRRRLPLRKPGTLL